MDTPATLLTDISNLAAEHRSWARWDFVFAQSLLWLGVLSSVIAGILAVAWNPGSMRWKVAKVAIAGLPALTLTAEQSFKFCQRYQWHDEYYAELHALENSLRFEKATEETTSAKESKVVKDMVAKFPSMTFQTVTPPERKTRKAEEKPDENAPVTRDLR